jgi:hypothetical protein
MGLLSMVVVEPAVDDDVVVVIVIPSSASRGSCCCSFVSSSDGDMIFSSVDSVVPMDGVPCDDCRGEIYATKNDRI